MLQPLLFTLLLLTAQAASAADAPYQPSPENLQARQWFQDADDAAKQRGLAGTIGPDNGEQRARSDLARKMMHRRVPVIAQRDVFELQRRGHAHLIASQTMAQRQALTASAALKRETTVMRRIDHGAACAGCGTAGSWLWWAWP